MIQKMNNHKTSKQQSSEVTIAAVVACPELDSGSSDRQLKTAKLFILTILLIPLIMVQTSCKKFVQLDPPSSVLVTASTFNNDGAATSAVVALYSDMANNAESFSMAQNSGLLGDELFSLSTNAQVQPYFQNTLVASNSSGSTIYYGPWRGVYSYIFRANAIIEGLQNYRGTSSRVNEQLTGEAKLVRAFWYFYLTNCYGAVPLATTTDYTVNAHLSRTPREAVYQQITNDLLEAENLLDNRYVDGSDTAQSADRIRPNKSVAEALLARVYLYQNKYDSAELEAGKLLSNPAYSLEPDLNNVFLSTSQEAVWQIAMPDPNSSAYQTFDGNRFILIAAPGNGTINCSEISTWLMNSFEPGDQRKISWIDSLTINGSTYYFPYKYQVYLNSMNPNNRTEYAMMIRLAELCLIRAEARLKKSSPDITGALSDLNAIRHRAGLGDYAGATDVDSLMAAILHERQVELFTEWGHRWFDLIRTNTINSVMGAPGNVCQQKGGTWSDYKALYPIPQSEIDKDVNLTQNPGY